MQVSNNYPTNAQVEKRQFFLGGTGTSSALTCTLLALAIIPGIIGMTGGGASFTVLVGSSLTPAGSIALTIIGSLGLFGIVFSSGLCAISCIYEPKTQEQVLEDKEIEKLYEDQDRASEIKEDQKFRQAVNKVELFINFNQDRTAAEFTDKDITMGMERFMNAFYASAGKKHQSQLNELAKRFAEKILIKRYPDLNKPPSCFKSVVGNTKHPYNIVRSKWEELLCEQKSTKATSGKHVAGKVISPDHLGKSGCSPLIEDAP